MQRPNEQIGGEQPIDSQALAIREQETAVVDAMVRLTKLDEQHARQLVLQLCQGLNIPVDGVDHVDTAPSATQQQVEAMTTELAAKQQGEQPSITQQVQATPQIGVPSHAGQGSEASSVNDVSLTASATLADDTFSSEPELSSPLEREENEFTVASTPSMELQLGAGSDLQMSALPESTLSLTEPVMSGLQSPGEDGPRTSPVTTVRAGAEDAPSLAIETKAIIDDTPDVTAFAAPQIEAAAPSIVDTTKRVTELDTANIEVHQDRIEDNTQKVTAIIAPVIPEPAAAIQTQAPAIRPFSIGETAAIPTTPLRESHVVQPGGRQSSARNAEPDLIIDAELIPIDGDEDAIIIIDKNV